MTDKGGVSAKNRVEQDLFGLLFVTGRGGRAILALRRNFLAVDDWDEVLLALALGWGVLVGTYSSVGLAVPLLVLLKAGGEEAE